MNRCALLAAACMTLIVGCASNGNQATGNQTSVASEDKEYVTGSRIPVKSPPSGVKATSDRNTIDELIRKGSGSGGGMTGAGGT